MTPPPLISLVGLLLVFATSCSVVQGVADAPGKIVSAVTRAPSDEKSIDLDAVRGEAMRFADRIVAQVDKAAYLSTASDASDEAAERALEWRAEVAEQAFQIAAQSRPVAALADLVALCTYEQLLHEAYWLPKLGEADRPLLEAWTNLAQQGAAAAKRYLPEKQSEALTQRLARWAERVDDPDKLLRGGAPRFQELAMSSEATEQNVSLLSVLGLDPLDSIEPAARELARTRELGERAVFLAQRLPRTLAWRTELLTLRTARQPGVSALLADADRVSKASESIAATARSLPEKLRTEGDALIQHVSTELTAQRTGLVADLERTSEPTRALLEQVQGTLAAATELSHALDDTSRNVGDFVERVSPRDVHGSPNEEPASDAVAGVVVGGGAIATAPRAKRFDPVEYTEMAERWTGALHELNTTVSNVDRNLPALRGSIDEAATRLDRSVERAWRLALVLVLTTIAAVSVAVVVVRKVSRRSA